ncbi:MAG: cellobiose phosphorylase, partial [Fervidobacterium sp.]
MNYSFDKFGRFVIEGYNNSKPFSSFLPGIAGLKGIPLWVFYVNRGQCIASFGISNKDKPILEFHPAFRAYQLTNNFGFRTFIKINGKYYEPFTFRSSESATQEMYIGKNELEISEYYKEFGLKTSITYFLLPNERVAALVRIVNIRNASMNDLSIELLDGISILLPTGVNDYLIKHMGNTLRAWMDVYNLESGVPLFKLRSSTEDVARIEEIKDANFYISTVLNAESSQYITPIVDPDNVFAHETSYNYPIIFAEKGLKSILEREQHTTNKIPCAFTPFEGVIKSNESVRILTVIGYVPDEKLVETYKEKLRSEPYLLSKLQEARTIVENITKDIETHTNYPLFDEYSRQTYLDNVLRGGYPIVFSDFKKIYHVYSRKHGDLERDYNYFNLLAEYYSSGNGNYRDINQNRRNDVLFNPKVGSYNIRFFVNLIQADGYNPLIINGVRYKVSTEKLGFLEDICTKEEAEKIRNFLSSEYFTPGKVAMLIEKENIKMNIPEEEFIRKLIELSNEEIDAV